MPNRYPFFNIGNVKPCFQLTKPLMHHKVAQATNNIFHKDVLANSWTRNFLIDRSTMWKVLREKQFPHVTVIWCCLSFSYSQVVYSSFQMQPSGFITIGFTKEDTEFELIVDRSSLNARLSSRKWVLFPTKSTSPSEPNIHVS